MPSLKYIRKRIQSVEGICKITSAMSLISSSKLRHFQHVKNTAITYVKNLEVFLPALAYLDFCPSYLTKSDGKTLWLIITTQKGFCGSFVANLFKEAKQHIRQEDELWIFGERGKQVFKKSYPHATFYPFDHKFHTEMLLFSELSQVLLKKLQETTIGKICLIHAQMKNIMSYPVLVQTLFPLTSDKYFITLEPKDSSVIQEIMIHYLSLRLYSAFMESAACEHAARMISMDLATKNTKELIDRLRLTYNKARQNIITNELVEIISGSEVL